MVNMSNKRKVLGDYYYKQAKKEGYRSRSALKLKEISEKYAVIRKGDRIVDLGAAPGGWLQVERDFTGESGLVIGVDLSSIRSLPYDTVTLIQGDINDPAVLGEILAISNGPVDVLVSDLAPKLDQEPRRNFHPRCGCREPGGPSLERGDSAAGCG